MAKSREAHLTISTFKGMNITDPPHVIDDREFEVLQNGIINDAGDFIRRKPMRVFILNPDSNTKAQILGVFYNRILWTSGDNIYLSDPDTDVGTAMTTVLVSTAGEDADSAILYNKNLYIWSAGSAPSLTALTVSDWTVATPTFGAATVTGTPPDDISRSVIFKDRLFAIRVSEFQSSRVYYSAVTDPGNWTGGGFFDVVPGDGDYITDIIPFGERLFIFKRYSCHVLTVTGDPAGWIQKPFDKNVGALGPFCTLEYRGLLYLLSYKGLYRCDGVVLDFVGYPIQDRFTDNIQSVTSSEDRSRFMCMVDDYLFISINVGSSVSGYFFYNPVQNAWSECVFATTQDLVGKLFRGTQGILSNGVRGTWFGTDKTSSSPNVAGPIWFGLGDMDMPSNTAYSDYSLHNATVGSRIIDPIIITIKTKMWDLGAFWRLKRNKFSTIEINVPTQEQITDAEFTAQYKFDQDMISTFHEFRVDNNHRGTLAYKIPGVGYHRRMQLQLTTSNTLEFMITGYDITYLMKAGQGENPE